jgi:autotransporter adhesin
MNTKQIKRHQLAVALLLAISPAFAFAQSVQNDPSFCVRPNVSSASEYDVGPEANNFGCGPNSTTTGGNATTLGANTRATQNGATAIGSSSDVDGVQGTAVGAFSRVNAGVTSAGAFGFGSIADRSNAISFGNAGQLRQLIYVAAGTQDTDAVNLGQVRALMQAFGGGGTISGGVYSPVNYSFTSGGTFDNVGDALLYLDGRITRISLTPGPQGPQGPQGPAGPGGADCNTAVCYDDTTHNTATLNNGGSPTRLRNVADGVNASDAVNLGQMQAADLDTLNQANDYTDARVSNILTVMDDRFEGIERRMSRMGAMNSAMSMMTASAAGVQSANKVAVGVGYDGGEAAIAAGYQKLFGNGAVVTLGASYSGGDTQAGVGFGFGF